MRFASLLGTILLGLAACARADEALTVLAVLPNAPGLNEGASVTYRGVEVGTVEHISFSDTAVQIQLHLTRSDVPLRVGDQVRIASLGLLGDKIVDIVPGPVSARALTHTDTLGAAPADSLAAARADLAEEIVNSFLKRMNDAPNRLDSFRLGSDSTWVPTP
jgi:ABC-type transporter Mla subunit MlaD